MSGLITFTVALPGPADLPMSLEPLRRWGDDGLDRWDGTHLLRTVAVDRQMVPMLCVPGGTIQSPVLRVTIHPTVDPAQVTRAAHDTLIPTAPDFADLCRRDEIISQLDRRYPGLRDIRQLDLLGALIRAISAQQVNLRWAATTRRRLAETYGTRHDLDGQQVWSLDAAQLAGADVPGIRALQFTERKAEYLIGVADEIASGRLRGEDLVLLSDDEVIARLVRLRGIGVWTVEWILARHLGRGRVVAGDLGVRKAIGLAYLNGALPTEHQVREITAHWKEAAGLAQTLVLRLLVEGRNDKAAAPSNEGTTA